MFQSIVGNPNYPKVQKVLTLIDNGKKVPNKMRINAIKEVRDRNPLIDLMTNQMRMTEVTGTIYKIMKK